MKEHPTVIQQLTARCEIAYKTRTPIVFFETQEKELMELIVRKQPVPLLRMNEGSLWKGYYRLLSEGEELDYGKIRNLYRDAKGLEQLCRDTEDLFRETPPPSVVLLHLNADEIQAQRKALNLYTDARARCIDPQSPLLCSLVLLYGNRDLLPKEELGVFTEIVEIPYPEEDEILQEIRRLSANIEFADADRPGKLAHEMLGFGLMEVRRCVTWLLQTKDGRGNPMLNTPEWPDCVRTVRERKYQVVLRNGPLLTLIQEDRSENSIAGLDAFKHWVDENLDHLQHPERFRKMYGIGALKGVLLTGITGCGKSEAAYYLQQKSGLPMLRMDVGRLMAGVVGGSESNLRASLQQADAMAPVIMWIEELEKGFSAANGEGGGAKDTFQRMFSTFLVWANERKRPVFFFATANDIGKLPVELVRKGRFDTLFSLMMPSQEEFRAQMIEHMRRAERERRAELGRSGTEDSLFDKACYSDKVFKALFKRLVGNKTAFFPREQTPKAYFDASRELTGIKFFNGADIADLVKFALKNTPRDRVKVLSESDWIDALCSVIDSPEFSAHGDSTQNLDRIAAAYCRLLSGPFVPASDRPLFRKQDYRILEYQETEDNKKAWDESMLRRRVELIPHPPEGSDYDCALYYALFSRIERIGTFLAQQEAKQW